MNPSNPQAHVPAVLKENPWTTVGVTFKTSTTLYYYKVELPVEVGDTLQVNVGKHDRRESVTVFEVHDTPRINALFALKWGKVIAKSAKNVSVTPEGESSC
jgi:hypothetical protein